MTYLFDTVIPELFSAFLSFFSISNFSNLLFILVLIFVVPFAISLFHRLLYN